MRRRRRLRRRLLWAGVLLGLLVLAAAAAVVRAAISARDRLSAIAGRTPTPTTRRETPVFRKTSFTVLALAAALICAAPASADRWWADLSHDATAAPALPDAHDRAPATAAAHDAIATAPALPDAHDRAPATAALGGAMSAYSDWFERVAAAHSLRGPAAPAGPRADQSIASAPAATPSARDVDWLEAGIGFALGVVLAGSVAAAVRLTRPRPLAH